MAAKYSLLHNTKTILIESKNQSELLMYNDYFNIYWLKNSQQMCTKI